MSDWSIRLSMYQRFLFLLVPALAASGSPDALETARSAVKEWATTEKAISHEAAEWEQREQLLTDLIELETQRIARLETERSENEADMNAAGEERQGLLNRESSAKEMASKIEAFLQELEGELRFLKLQLPAPLLKDLAAAYQRLPEKGENKGLSLGERMRTVIGMMGRIRQFDGTLSVSEAIRELPDGAEASVRTIYAGLGQAFYLAPKDAGYGIPTETGWVWESAPEFADAIREALLILDGESPEPKFVGLPVREVGRKEVSK